MFFVLAYTDNTFRFTSLAQYQLYQSQDDPANAPPALTIKFYTELMDSKQVVSFSFSPFFFFQSS